MMARPALVRSAINLLAPTYSINVNPIYPFQAWMEVDHVQKHIGISYWNRDCYRYNRMVITLGRLEIVDQHP